MRSIFDTSGFRAMGIGLTGFALAGCAALGGALESEVNAGPCPTAASVYEAQRVVMFSGGTQTYGNISWTGEITNVEMFCRYVDDNPIEAELEITFAFGKGPAATGNRQTYPYFVAVTRRNRSVLEREVFAVEAVFSGNETVTGARELVGRLSIPRYDTSISGANFEVLVGFDLTEEQAAFNRAGKRFRLDAATGLSQ